MIYIFMGPPASGKSTQARLLAHTLNLPFYSVGDLLRKKAEKDPEIAEKINKGILLPASSVIKILKEVCDEHTEDVVIDGVLRRAEQVDKLLQIWDNSSIAVIQIELSEESIRKRAKHRTDTADKRKDDNPKIVEDRIKRYFEHLPLVLGRLSSYHVPVITVGGEDTIDHIHTEIYKELRNRDYTT